MPGYHGTVTILDEQATVQGSGEALLWREPVRGGGWRWGGVLRLSAATAAQLPLGCESWLRLRLPSGWVARVRVIDEAQDPDWELEVVGEGPPPFP